MCWINLNTYSFTHSLTDFSLQPVPSTQTYKSTALTKAMTTTTSQATASNSGCVSKKDGKVETKACLRGTCRCTHQCWVADTDARTTVRTRHLSHHQLLHHSCHLHSTPSRVYASVTCPSVPSTDRSSCEWLVCCWMPCMQEMSIDSYGHAASTMLQVCWHSAANTHSVTLRAKEWGSMQTCSLFISSSSSCAGDHQPFVLNAILP